MEIEKELLLKCRQLVEQSLNWGDSASWGNDDFDQLSEKIFEKTKVRLSVSTLKRIWGRVRYESFPTTATLNALVSFVGFENWREFRQKNLNVIDDDFHDTLFDTNEALDPPKSKTKRRRFYVNSIWVIILFSIILVVLSAVYIARKKATLDPSKIKFSAVKSSDDLPNSVVFNYDASVFNSDSVYIQQSWDPNRREKVPAFGKQHTSIYYNPGYFIAKLVVDNQIKKECVVSIKTKGWKGTIEAGPVPVYLSESDIKHNGYMGVTDSLLSKKTGTAIFNNVETKFANVREFEGIDPGNFSFETTFRNTSKLEASACRKVFVYLLGKGGAIGIPFSDKGCISDLNVLTGNYYMSGKDHDMSAFGCDFSQFQHLKLIVKNHRFMVYNNDKLILNLYQKEPTNGIVGIRYEFEGSGQVKDYKLETPGGKSYGEEF
jgi:hypothetical protein